MGGIGHSYRNCGSTGRPYYAWFTRNRPCGFCNFQFDGCIISDACKPCTNGLLAAFASSAVLAVSINGFSPDRRKYLALGGPGIHLGDGRLHYGTEQILEWY